MRTWKWSQAETSLHINCLKLRAGAFAVKTFTKGNTQMTFRLLVDNMFAAHYINKFGGQTPPFWLVLHSIFGISVYTTR